MFTKEDKARLAIDVVSLEEKLDTPYEEWTNDTLTAILEDDSAIELFTPELVAYLLLERENPNIFDTLLPVKYGFDLRAIKEMVEELLRVHKEDGGSLEDFKTEVLKIEKSESPIFKVVAYLTILAAFEEDYDLKVREKEIRKTIDEYVEILKSLKIDEGFQVIIELFDLIFPFCELYFQRYNVDLLKDNSDFQEILGSVNAKTQEMMEFIEQMEKEIDIEENDTGIETEEE
jgi:hypothetical protein